MLGRKKIIIIKQAIEKEKKLFKIFFSFKVLFVYDPQTLVLQILSYTVLLEHLKIIYSELQVSDVSHITEFSSFLNYLAELSIGPLKFKRIFQVKIFMFNLIIFIFFLHYTIDCHFLLNVIRICW